LSPHTPIAALIDHTLLRPEAAGEQIRTLCREAREFGFAAVCVNPYWVPLAAAELAACPVRVGTVVGFPLGASTTGIKVAETEEAVRSGAREIDMVLNIGELRAGHLSAVRGDIQAVADAAHAGRAILKVILETALLSDTEKRHACEAAREAAADFVKTSTGFGPGGATAADVELLRHAAGPSMGVKASGGIRTLADACRMLAAGATRLGTSSGVQIVREASKEHRSGEHGQPL
jgi:deoxyribose-phosphate aldolase